MEPNWLLIYVILPTVSAFFGGGALLAVQRAVERRKATKQFLPKFEAYAGIWHGIHLSRARPGAGLQYSEHKYDLEVKKNLITGTFDDNIEGHPYHYEVKGEITPGGIILQSRCDTRDNLIAVEVYPEPTVDTLRGLLVSHDYLGQAFASPILLLKGKKPTPTDYQRYVASSAEHLYASGPVDRNLLPAYASEETGQKSNGAETECVSHSVSD